MATGGEVGGAGVGGRLALSQKIAFGRKWGVSRRTNLGQLGAYKSLNPELQDSDTTAFCYRTLSHSHTIRAPQN